MNMEQSVCRFISALTFATSHTETFGQRPAAPVPRLRPPLLHIHEGINVIERHEAERARLDDRRRDSRSPREFELLFLVQESVTALRPSA